MDEQITVVHFSKTLGLGGCERNIESVARHLTSPFKHEVIVLFGSEQDDRCKALTEAGVPVFFLHGKLHNLTSLLARRLYDAALLHRSGQAEPCWSTVLAACRDKCIRVVLEYNVFSLPDLSREDSIIDRHFHKSMTSYLQFSERARKAAYGHPERHGVLFNATDIDRFSQWKLAAEQRMEERRSIGLAPDSFVLLRVGRADVRKWGDFLLRAIPLVVGRLPRAQFVLRTVPRSREAWIRSQPWGNRVIILPATASDRVLATTYQMADVLTHSSRRGETHPNTVLEAASLGIPAIVHATPWRDNSQVEMVDHMRTGIVANTPEDYAAAITYLYQNRSMLHQLGEGARRKVQAYAANAVAQSLGRQIVDLLSAHKAVGTQCRDRTKDWAVYPTAEAITEYAQEYPGRIKQAWSRATPERGGPFWWRGRWFARDAFEVIGHRMLSAASELWHAVRTRS